MEQSLFYWNYLTQYTFFLSGLVEENVIGGENVGKFPSMKNR